MDPVGPWSAYASYNRLAGAQAGAGGGDFHHHLGAGGGAGAAAHSAHAPATTGQLLLQAAHSAHSTAALPALASAASPFNPGGFLSPAPVAYDAVFSPLFHHAAPKPAHYSPASAAAANAQHRQALAQQAAKAAEPDYAHHQPLPAQGSAFFEQQAWQGNGQLPSPFGILPHESVVPNSPGAAPAPPGAPKPPPPAAAAASASAAAYDNFNAHFAVAQTLNNHLNSQLAAGKARAASPHAAKPAPAAQPAFFQPPAAFSPAAAAAQTDFAGKQRTNSTNAPAARPAAESVKPPEKRATPATGPGSGFMASYLKFLQGERDTSPPPAGRGGRKAAWSRSAGAAGKGPEAGKPDAAHNGAAPALAAKPEAEERERRRLEEEEARKPVLNVPAPAGPPAPGPPAGPAAPADKGKKRGARATAPAPKKRAPPAPPPAAQPPAHYYYQQPEEVAAHNAGIDYTDYSIEDQGAKKMQQRNAQQQPVIAQTANAARPAEDMPYQNGEFVAMKSELNEAWPVIWRVDGKSLLQRFDPFDQNGKVLYRNISTYAAWNPENKKTYVQVPVRVRAQSHLETVVELMRNELPIDDNEFLEKRIQETLVYQDNFEVYIQTLISHALDPNFLTEIFQEQDEYFLSNVKTVDEVTEERRGRVARAGGWPRGVEAALATWPFLAGAEAGAGGAAPPAACRACGRPARARLSLYGQPYEAATLEARAPLADARAPLEKEFAACGGCAARAQLYVRAAHQKYLMFLECSKRVADKRLRDPRKDTTVVLNELLADEAWLSQLFRDIRQTWAEAELMEKKSRQNMPRQDV